ncbi:MAG TPA: hypothetical protein VFP68_08540 [Burkholderiaceae bacterium]|nr:hypothetical protein [Burkholderiaceae bacterium]
MKTIRLLAATAVLALSASTTLAQPGPRPGYGSGPAASMPHGGPGGPGGRMGGRWGSDFTPGWSLMTPQERQEHQARMRAMTTYDECRTYMDQHHESMAARAKDQGRTMPSQPRRDACAGLKR